MHLPTIKQLQYLIALADHASFSEAAFACNVTQSTLSAGIAELESTLGQKLADRGQRRVALTPLGIETVEKARQIVQDTSSLIARARSLSDPLSGPLRLGIIPTVAPWLLPRILPALRKKFPALELQLKEDLSARIVEDARLNRLDMILLAFPFETPGMKQYVLYEESFVLAAPKSQWHGSHPVKTAELANEPLLLLDEGHCLRDHALAACHLQPRRERQTFSATSLPTLIQMVANGYGMTLLPEMASHSLPRNIDIIPFRTPVPARQIGLAWRGNHPRAQAFQKLSDAIKAAINN